MQSVFCERLDGFGYASREPRGVSSSLFPAQIKRAPTSGTPSIWRREEDVRRLRLESVVPRGRIDRIFGLGVRASLARTSGECRNSQSLPRATKKARQGRAIPWRREEDDLRLYELGCSRFFARGSMASATPRANLAEFLQVSSPRK